MEDGSSGEFWYAYHAYHKSGMLPSRFSALPIREKAMLKAFIDIEAERIEQEEKKAKRRARRK